MIFKRMLVSLVFVLSTSAPVTAALAAPVDNHETAPGKDIAAYTVAAAKEPKLGADQVWKLLRQRIKYVFVIYQENRSFDSYFGTFPGADGLFSRAAGDTSGFEQELMNIDGTVGKIHPFRIGPEQYAADTDDVDHTHTRIVAKMHVVDGRPRMDRFAAVEERKYSPFGNPSLQAKQFGELAMAHEDCDTVPLLWRYADRFVLFDQIFQLTTGPSTPGNLSIIAAQTGETQWALHPEQAYQGDGEKGMGVPMVNDADPFWGSQLDNSLTKMPVSPADIKGTPPAVYDTQRNLTFASLPLTLEGNDLAATSKADTDPDGDLRDVRRDIDAISRSGKRRIAFGWYEEGYDREPTDPGPTDAEGTHASYIAHHNGPQYFGYVANNPKMRANLHGLQDFFDALDSQTLPKSAGVFYVKGGYQNTLGLKPANPDPQVQKNFVGDDDHPAYSDAQISEAMVATAINKIASSPYWSQGAIIVTWDDSEGDYDHVPPPIRLKGPDGTIITDGPRVPLLIISPYARVHFVSHATGDHASVVKFIDRLFDLTPLAELPDERRGRDLGFKRFGLAGLGPADALSEITDLAPAFDSARLSGSAAPLSVDYARVPDDLLRTLHQTGEGGCKLIGITPVDYVLGIKNEIPADFNPRPKTNPSPAQKTP